MATKNRQSAILCSVCALFMILYVVSFNTLHPVTIIHQQPYINDANISSRIISRIISSRNISNIHQYIPSIYANTEIHSNERIPFILWQTFEHHDIINYSRIKPWINLYKKNKFDYRLTDKYERELLFTNKYLTNSNEYKIFGGNITKAYLTINPFNGASKADYWRYYVLWKFGGIYLDIDAVCSNISPQTIQNIIHNNTKYKNNENVSIPFGIISNERMLLSPTARKHRFIMWGLMFSPKHPFLTETIRRSTNKILNVVEKNKIFKNMKKITLETTGTVLWSRTIYDVINPKNTNNYPQFEYYIDGRNFASIQCLWCNYTIKHQMYLNMTRYEELEQQPYLIQIN